MSNPIQAVVVRANQCGELRTNYIGSMNMIGQIILIPIGEGGSNNQGL